MTLITSTDTPHAERSVRGDRSLHRSVCSFTRGTATGYGLLDVISDDEGTEKALEFTNCGAVEGGAGLIRRAMVIAEDLLVNDLTLWVFDEEPTNFADNAPLVLVNADTPKIVAVFNFYGGTASVGAGATDKTVWHGNNPENAAANVFYAAPHTFVCAADSRSLYGLLVAGEAIATVESGCKFLVSLDIERYH